MSLSGTQRIESLTESFNANIVEIFEGKGICTDNFFTSFCKQTEVALDLFLSNDVDLKDKTNFQFLNFTLPRIVDIFLRRSTKRSVKLHIMF